MSIDQPACGQSIVSVHIDPSHNKLLSSAMLLALRIGLSGALPAFAISCTIAFCFSSSIYAADSNPVRFDVPALVVAERVSPDLVSQPIIGGELVRLRFPVSAYVETGFRGQIAEYSVELISPAESVRVVDFWPRNEAYSQVAGTISVESSQQHQASLKFGASAGVEPMARGQMSGDFQRDSATREKYERMPAAEAWTSSGTIARGYGVFFKFRPGPSPNLEGSRQLAVLAEVPQGWQADMILVRVSATGKSSGSGFKSNVLADSMMWMTVHREGDMAAAARAKRFVTQERSLRAMAASRAEEVKNKSMPTVFHRVGAALDIMAPRIPKNYLVQVIFGPRNQYFEGGSHRLPVDLRVAILDFWDAREELLEMASGSSVAGSSKPGDYIAADEERPDFEHPSWHQLRDAS